MTDGAMLPAAGRVAAISGAGRGLGAAIARIVRVVVKMAQMDLCQGGMASVAAYTLMPALTGDRVENNHSQRGAHAPHTSAPH